MKNILVLGAGRSSSSMIAYLLETAKKYQWQVVVGDTSLQAAREKVGDNPFGKAVLFDILDENGAGEVIRYADVVISLLPAHFHPKVAAYCLPLGKHLLTASYVSPEMQAFHDEAKASGLLFLNECGLDPGIDHMSAVQVMDKIRNEGGKLVSFESFTGGLIAPETDPQNPWRYKFTWNPRNVVMAGQGTAKYLQGGKYKFIPYQQLFSRITKIDVSGYGSFEGYANRDSLKYIETYGLQGIRTMLRGTLRNEGFCSAWNVLVQLGCCDDTYLLDHVDQMTHRGFLESFADVQKDESVEQSLTRQFKLSKDGPELKRLQWSGFFSEEKIGLDKGSPAQILEHILNKRWKLQASDKDMIVMWHRFVYVMKGAEKEIQASLVAKGDDAVYTAMAKTVGLPLAIAAKLLMLGKIKTRGVAIPVHAELYESILEELGQSGIVLDERQIR
jgi:saccharopine dehydrogenase-like NADP-dependent oxidoreductase